ncbi:MAG: murein biosynthesis integral membrane protein MurJ [Desulfamplus sp.]|nr:murein biosynthesis integral membrane protein MurJ [Desulfamplus sp.]
MRQNSSTLKKVGIASFIMILSVFSSRVIGLVREMTIAFAGGAAGEVDAYQIAFIIPEILNHVVASGFLSVTFIPIFSSYLAKDDEGEGWRVFSTIFNTFSIALIIFIAIAFYYSPQLVRFFAPGFKEPALFDSAVKMTRIIMPAQLFFFAGGMFMAVQFTKERFFIPALAPLLYNLGIIVGGLIGLVLNQETQNSTGMEGFAWGVLLGAFVGNFALQYFGAKRVGMKISFIVNLKHPEFVKYIVVTVPLIVGVSMTFSTEIFLKYFGSYLPNGTIAALNYALRVMFILVGIFGQAVGVASYPFMANLASLGKIDELNELLNTTLKYLLLVIPISVLFMVLRYEIIFLLFERGRFDPNSTRITSQILPFIMAGTFAFAAQTVVVRGYYATQNTWFPAIFSTAATIGSIPLFFILMRWIGAQGVAIALSLSAFINSGLLFTLWNKKSGNIGAGSVYLFMVKVIALSCGIGLILWKITLELKSILGGVTPIYQSLIVSTVIAFLFIVLFILSGTIFKIKEITVFTNKIFSRVKRLF